MCPSLNNKESVCSKDSQCNTEESHLVSILESQYNWHIHTIVKCDCFIHCVVPEIIHTHPMEGHWKSLGGEGGGLRG